MQFVVEDVEQIVYDPNWWQPRVKAVKTWLGEEVNRVGIDDDGAEEVGPSKQHEVVAQWLSTEAPLFYDRRSRSRSSAGISTQKLE